ncbi:MAG TPA: putative toxin-antitoxin system toxin component, PIN family [Fimbriiglobus sp.]|nr:putative toxin-antitoxin system toxin component, PIN family [Fimbriiglobus sp.]
MRVVVDTNVLVSTALDPGSVPGRVVEAVITRGRLLVSGETLRELERVLQRPRLDKFSRLADRLRLLAQVTDIGELIVVQESVTACRDPKDDKFLEVAVNSNATHLVTGDRDLLALHPFRDIPILTPADFLALIGPPIS